MMSQSWCYEQNWFERVISSMCFLKNACLQMDFQIFFKLHESFLQIGKNIILWLDGICWYSGIVLKILLFVHILSERNVSEAWPGFCERFWITISSWKWFFISFFTFLKFGPKVIHWKWFENYPLSRGLISM